MEDPYVNGGRLNFQSTQSTLNHIGDQLKNCSKRFPTVVKDTVIPLTPYAVNSDLSHNGYESIISQ